MQPPIISYIEMSQQLDERLKNRRARRPAMVARSKLGASTRRHRLDTDPVAQEMVRF